MGRIRFEALELCTCFVVYEAERAFLIDLLLASTNVDSLGMTITFGLSRVDPLLFHMDILKSSGRVFKSAEVATGKRYSA